MIGYLALGSNLGDRANYLNRARAALAAHGLRIVRDSGDLDNAPILVEDQPRFLNAILEIETTLSAHELLALCKDTERALGRTSTVRYGPRQIDIDILTLGDLKVTSPELTLPHPGLLNRDYLRELAARLNLTPESIAGDAPPA